MKGEVSILITKKFKVGVSDLCATLYTIHYTVHYTLHSIEYTIVPTQVDDGAAYKEYRAVI